MNITDFSNDAFAAYVAGLLDGEGSIEIHPKQCGIRVRIANTFKQVLDDIHSRLGYGKVESYPKRPTLPLFTFCTSSAHDSRSLLLLCRPYIQIKAARAEKALEIIAAMQERANAADERNAAIVAALAEGHKQTDIGKRFGVTQSYVSYVKLRLSKPETRLNARRSLKKGIRPSEALFTHRGDPLSLPCRPPTESASRPK